MDEGAHDELGCCPCCLSQLCHAVTLSSLEALEATGADECVMSVDELSMLSSEAILHLLQVNAWFTKPCLLQPRQEGGRDLDILGKDQAQAKVWIRLDS